MTWINWLLLGIIVNALSPILQKKILVNKPEGISPQMVWTLNLTGSTIVLLFYLLIQGGLSFNLAGKELNVLLVLVLYTAGNYLTANAMLHLTAAEGVIIGTSSVIWSVLTAALFLGEQSSLLNIFGIILILSGVVLLNYQEKKFKLGKGHLELLIANIFYGVAFVDVAYVVKTSEPISFSFLSFALASFGLLSVSLSSTKPKAVVNYLKSKKTILDIFLFSTLSAIGFLSSFLAFRAGGLASQISPLSQLAVLLTVLISIVVLKEHHSLVRKLLAAVVMVIGAILVNIA